MWMSRCLPTWRSIVQLELKETFCGLSLNVGFGSTRPLRAVFNASNWYPNKIPWLLFSCACVLQHLHASQRKYLITMSVGFSEPKGWSWRDKGALQNVKNSRLVVLKVRMIKTVKEIFFVIIHMHCIFSSARPSNVRHVHATFIQLTHVKKRTRR